jgi:hypothetical protein
VLNAEANVEVDITALDAVEKVRRELEERGIVFAMARVKQDLLDDLEAFGLAATVGADRIFPTLPTAVEAYERWRSDPPGHHRSPSGRSDRPEERDLRPGDTRRLPGDSGRWEG